MKEQVIIVANMCKAMSILLSYKLQQHVVAYHFDLNGKQAHIVIGGTDADRVWDDEIFFAYRLHSLDVKGYEDCYYPEELQRAEMCKVDVDKSLKHVKPNLN